MDEKDFEILKALSEAKNITKAADLLFVSQSSLSKRIHAIEQELGILILIRTRQGVHFTPEGEEVLLRASNAAKELEKMRENINIKRDLVCGTLKIGVSINYVLYRFPEILATYRKQYPHVDTHINTDQSRKLYTQLAEGDMDIAVIRGEYPWKEHKILLDTENICAIFNQEDKNKPLKSIPFIGRKTDFGFHQELSRWMHENNLPAKRHGIYVDNIATCVEMVNQGVGWSIVPEICLNHFKGHIQPLHFKDGTPFTRSTYLMYTNASLLLPQVKAFISTLRKEHRLK